MHHSPWDLQELLATLSDFEVPHVGGFRMCFLGHEGPYVGSLRKMKMKQTSQTWRLICLLISWDLTYLMKIEVGVCFTAAW